MEYENIAAGRFIQRPNRFIAHVEIGGKEVQAHVRNTGRCKELLLPGATVYLEKSGNPLRKTAYSLVAVKKGAKLINIDSAAPNKVFEESLTKGFLPPALGELVHYKREAAFGGSRFDFYIEGSKGRAYVEVKGVTLENQGHCLFPDAPTQRGLKHLRELMEARKAGFYAYIVFIIQIENGIVSFAPNDLTQPAFSQALWEAEKQGVEIMVKTCRVTPRSIQMNEAAESPPIIRP